jgi:hypothetical protein
MTHIYLGETFEVWLSTLFTGKLEAKKSGTFHGGWSILFFQNGGD